MLVKFFFYKRNWKRNLSLDKFNKMFKALNSSGGFFERNVDHTKYRVSSVSGLKISRIALLPLLPHSNSKFTVPRILIPVSKSWAWCMILFQQNMQQQTKRNFKLSWDNAMQCNSSLDPIYPSLETKMNVQLWCGLEEGLLALFCLTRTFCLHNDHQSENNSRKISWKLF